MAPLCSAFISFSLPHSYTVDYSQLLEYSYRSEKKKELREFLSQQPMEIKAKYHVLMSSKKLKRKLLVSQAITRGKNSNAVDLLSKIEAIDTDMSISELEAERRENMLKNSLTPSQKEDFAELQKIRMRRKRNAGRSSKPYLSLAVIITCFRSLLV
ncbi:hypothetical protein Y032_0307g2021 [Ancylostoma ceylanicum]|uniref:Uncharacterized protein n=1 Tax=Ancylostoma ceylanicum TaxID=53326 RepID=A0A016S328_9BILA|nr:hypothetical protein Y032_0307g2021 [Ancylostoma ceylanicum]